VGPSTAVTPRDLNCGGRERRCMLGRDASEEEKEAAASGLAGS
jgi:hypothetical protein